MTSDAPDDAPEAGRKPVSPLARERAERTIELVAQAVLAGEPALSYSELAQRLGMSKVNGQGLASYLREAAALCAERGWPNVAAMVASRESIEAGAPMPSEGSLSDGLYAATGLTREGVPDEQARVRAFDWRGVPDLDLTP